MMEEKKGLLRIAPGDGVAVALSNLLAGERYTVEGEEILLKDDIPFGHKIALRNFSQGENVIKYGHSIGHTTGAVGKGRHIHTHNLKTNLDGILEYTYSEAAPPPAASPTGEVTFQGYVRPDGRVGIRNEVWIIPTVGCVNMTAQQLAKQASGKFAGRVDGIYAYTHNMGCSQLGDDHRRTQQLLKGLIQNPNAGAVLVLSLGCENNNLDEFRPLLGELDENRVKFLVTQEADDEYAAGMELLEQLVGHASAARRTTVPASNLVVGFKCGGSDAFSGITANALCGRLNDFVTGCGGSTILTEVPEMFGAETILMERASDRETFDDIVELVNSFKGYFTKYDQTIYENPSPGNKKGGISTLEEKSLGCTQKGGKAPVAGVLGYGQQVKKHGLNLLIGPGNDQISCTNLVASGATMICFTTGRGNPYGAPVPTIKIASNTPLYRRKPHWIDFNAGQVLDGMPFDEMADQFFRYILQVASGGVTAKNEDYGYREISIFRDGVIL